MLILRYSLLAILLIALSPQLAAGDPDYSTEEPPILGTKFTPPPTRVLREQNLSPDEGVYVRKVYGNTAAHDMGMQKGDVILKINGQDIRSMSNVREIVSAGSVGEPVQVVVRRNGEDVSLSANYKPWPHSVKKTKIDAAAEQRYREAQKRRLARQDSNQNGNGSRDYDNRSQDDTPDKQSPRTGTGTGSNTPVTKAPDFKPEDLNTPYAKAFGKPASGLVPDIYIPPSVADLGDWEVAFDLHVADREVVVSDNENVIITNNETIAARSDLPDFVINFSLQSTAETRMKDVP